MNGQRRSGHTVTRFTAHLLWVTKYRYPVLKGDIKKGCRELIIQVCDAGDVHILKGAVEEMAERGYASAEEADVRYISPVLEPRLKHLMLSYDEAANKLVTEPANLEGTPFNDGELLGAHTGGSYRDGKWTDISRYYKFNEIWEWWN